MVSVIETLKDTEKAISALKKQLAEKEALLPGLRFAARLNGQSGHEDSADTAEIDASDMRLRMGEFPRRALSLLADKGTTVPYSAILKTVGGEARDARHAIRNLTKRGLAERDSATDTVRITPLGIDFMTKYRDK